MPNNSKHYDTEIGFWLILKIGFRMSYSDAQISRLGYFHATVDARCHTIQSHLVYPWHMCTSILAVQQSLCYMYHLLSQSRASVAEFFALVVPSAISLLTIFFSVWKRSGPLSNFFWSFCKKKTLIHTMYTITILFRAIPTRDSSQPGP